MFQARFDPQPELISEVLALRPLKEDDFEALFAAAGHPGIWAGHPAKDRYKRDVFDRYFQALLQSRATLAVLDQKTGAIIGCSRYYVAPDQPSSVSIGYTFLNHAYWGGSTNFELKRLMIEHAFKTFSEVWFHIDPTNVRSQKATAKLGARHMYDALLNLSGVPADWVCFRLDKDAWDLAVRAKLTN